MIEVTEVRNESLSVVTSTGVGTQKKDKVGYEILCFNGSTKTVTAYLSETLGTVNGYDQRSTECIIKAFDVGKELSDYFRDRIKYDTQEIAGVLGLKNACDLIYDVSAKDLGLIQPPHMPNIRFSRFSLTNEFICWGSFGVDPDIFDVANPTFYVHQTQTHCAL